MYFMVMTLNPALISVSTSAFSLDLSCSVGSHDRDPDPDPRNKDKPESVRKIWYHEVSSRHLTSAGLNLRCSRR